MHKQKVKLLLSKHAEKCHWKTAWIETLETMLQLTQHRQGGTIFIRYRWVLQPTTQSVPCGKTIMETISDNGNILPIANC